MKILIIIIAAILWVVFFGYSCANAHVLVSGSSIAKGDPICHSDASRWHDRINEDKAISFDTLEECFKIVTRARCAKGDSVCEAHKD